MKALNHKNLHRREETPYIPTDIFADILCRLPSDHLVNLKLVSKQWKKSELSTRVQESTRYANQVNLYWMISNVEILFALGRHPFTGEYVLVLANFYVLGQAKHIMFKVYSLSRSSLISSSTKLEVDMNTTYVPFQKIGTLLHGRLHCPTYRSTSDDQTQSIVLVYDFRTNGVEQVQPCFELGVVDGCVCAIGSSDVWMMKEYGVKESWSKYAESDERSVWCNFWTPAHHCVNGRNLSVSKGWDFEACILYIA